MTEIAWLKSRIKRSRERFKKEGKASQVKSFRCMCVGRVLAYNYILRLIAEIEKEANIFVPLVDTPPKAGCESPDSPNSSKPIKSNANSGSDSGMEREGPQTPAGKGERNDDEDDQTGSRLIDIRAKPGKA